MTLEKNLEMKQCFHWVVSEKTKVIAYLFGPGKHSCITNPRFHGYRSSKNGGPVTC